MGWPFGEEALAIRLEELRKACDNYFGVIQERLAGLNTKLPEKPEALVLVEQVIDTGLPLVPGGLLDQPHIWILEYRVCTNSKNVFENIRKRQEEIKLRQQLQGLQQQRG